MGKKRVLICNRGEIAIRLFRACRELGLTSVFFYPSALDVRLEKAFADESYEITTDDVYAPFLNIETILSYAATYQIDMLHPGYGFLAESPEFVKACQEQGLTFIGPSPETLALAGNKVTTKQKAAALGIPLLPSSRILKTVSDINHTIAHEKWDFPLMLKAAEGGGGRGIHLIQTKPDLAQKFQQIQQQIKAYFGSVDIFIEQYCTEARHIEIQVVGDGKDTYLVFPERDCTLQRKFQKIIEETPSSYISDQLRFTLQNHAQQLAKAISLRGIATVEFLVDGKQNYYFLEINPRIQVEHGITEMLTGIDLVKLQIQLALNKPLSLTQRAIIPRGWVIESRVTAENPWDNCTPSTGIITAYRPPSGPGIRVDDGLCTGQEITVHFDPLLAKIMVQGENRTAAQLKMKEALIELVLDGVVTNVALLQNLITSPEFTAAQHHTHFIEQYLATRRLTPTQQRLKDLLATKPLYEETLEEVIIAQLVAELYRSLQTQQHTSQTTHLPSLSLDKL